MEYHLLPACAHMVVYPHLFFWTVSSALHFSKLIFPTNLHLSTICELKLQMRVGSLTPKAVQRLTVFDPPTIGLGLESSCEKVILTKELRLRLETRFQQSTSHSLEMKRETCFSLPSSLCCPLMFPDQSLLQICNLPVCARGRLRITESSWKVPKLSQKFSSPKTHCTTQSEPETTVTYHLCKKPS